MSTIVNLAKSANSQDDIKIISMYLLTNLGNIRPKKRYSLPDVCCELFFYLFNTFVDIHICLRFEKITSYNKHVFFI